MDIKKRISIINKIKYKPIIIEKIFPLILNRITILDNLISRDPILKNQLNNIFSSVPKYKNNLGIEYNRNLENYSILRNINEKLNEYYINIKSKPITYDFIKSKINFSFMQYLYDSLLKYIQNKFYKFLKLDNKILKRIILEYYLSLDTSIISFLPRNSSDFDSKYFELIEEQNKYSKDKNKINQKIKLILIFDENDFYNKINYTIKYHNINKLELFFGEGRINKENLYKYFNNYLCNIDHLENITTLIIHNKAYENYLTDKNGYNTEIEIDNEFYQSLLSFLFDYYYLEQNEDIKYQIKLIQNIKEILIENLSILYIYEKFKLYYCINDIFPLLNAKYNNMINFNKDNIPYISFYINNKIMIINNRDKPIKIDDIISFIDYQLNNNKNVEYLFIINYIKLLQNEKENDIKLNISHLKEFMFISQESENIQQLIDKIITNNNNYNTYEGYDKNNKLIYFRRGQTFIQSFDLIDLFKFNKNLYQIKFKNEKIIIKYNQERNSLQIINSNPKKSELNEIINMNNYLSINHFKQFIYSQKKLNELTIKNFDVHLNDIINNNIKILNINYEKNISILKYKITYDKSKNEIKQILPNLTYLNLGCDLDFIKDLHLKEFPRELKEIKIISKYKKNNKISKLKNKFKKHGKEIFFEFIDKNNNNIEEENEQGESEGEGDVDGNEDYYDDIEFDEYDEPVNKYKPEIYSKTSINGIKGKGKLIEKHHSYLNRFAGFIEDNKFYKFWEQFDNELSIYDYSNILKEYKKQSKIIDYRGSYGYYSLFGFTRYVKDIKILYRASEQKHFIIKDLLKLEDILSKNMYILIMKLSNDVFFYMKSMQGPNSYNYRNNYFFTIDHISYICSNSNIIFNKKENRIEVKDCFKLNDYYSTEGIFTSDVKFKDKILKEKSTFNILDIEILRLIINPKYSDRFI